MQIDSVLSGLELARYDTSLRRFAEQRRQVGT